MRRWAWLVLALTATAASARLTTFAWTNDPSWPDGTTLELCSNRVCASNITGTQHALDVPTEPGGRFDAGVRAIAMDGRASDWETVVQTWPAIPIGLWAYEEIEGPTVATFQTYTAAGVSSNQITVNVPSGTQDGDLLVALFINNSGIHLNNLTGWTREITNFDMSDTGSDPKANVFWRIASSEPASYTWTLDGTFRIGAVMTRWSGVDGTTPIESYSTSAYGTNDTTVRSSTVTTTDSPQTVVNAALVFSSSAITFTPPTNYTEHVDAGDTTSRAWMEISSYAVPSAGATGNIDATASAAVNQKGGIALVLNDAAGGGGPVALPRRALDGPFYGALRGSVR